MFIPFENENIRAFQQADIRRHQHSGDGLC